MLRGAGAGFECGFPAQLAGVASATGPTNDGAALAIELIQNVRRPDVREAFNAVAAQRLHNYVAGTMTLVEHSRRIMRGRTGPISDEFAARKTALLTNPEVVFVQDLRNFTLHRSLPLIGHRARMRSHDTPEPKMTGDVQLSVAQLSSWEGWRQPSRAFLHGQDTVVVLRPVVRRHGGLVIDINSWLLGALMQANKEALMEANKLINEWNAVVSGVGHR